MDEAESPHSDSNNSSTPTEVFVEHNPLSDEDDKGEENNRTMTRNAQSPGQETTHSDRLLASLVPKQTAVPRQIRRQSSSRVPSPGPLPKVNCQEKIVICLDLSTEMDNPPFRFGDGTKAAPLHVVKRIIELFVRNKNMINPVHEFALVFLCNNAMWVREFSSNPEDIIAVLQDVPETQECSTMDLASIFDVIAENVEMPKVSGDPRVTPPPFIVRALLLYGRSHCVPQLNKITEAGLKMRLSPYFVVDVLYIHEAPSDDNNCQEIAAALRSMIGHLSHMRSGSRNDVIKIQNAMAKMLAHPLQREQRSFK